MSFSRVFLHRPESALAVEKMSLQRDCGAATYQKCSQLCALSDSLAGILSTAEGWVRPLVNLAFSSPSLQFFWRPQGRITCFCKKASLTNFLLVEKKKENKLYTSCRKLARWSEVKMCICGLICISQPPPPPVFLCASLLVLSGWAAGDRVEGRGFWFTDFQDVISTWLTGWVSRLLREETRSQVVKGPTWWAGRAHAGWTTWWTKTQRVRKKQKKKHTRQRQNCVWSKRLSGLNGAKLT